MKTLKYIATGALAAALLVAGIVGCTDDNGGTGGSLRVNPTELTFDDNGWPAQTVEVSGAESWSVDAKPEWIEASQEGNNLVVSADGYSHFRDRKGEIVLKSGDATVAIAVTQTKSTTTLVEIDDAIGIPASIVSNNGRYVGGTVNAKSFLYDRMTDKTTKIGEGLEMFGEHEAIFGLADPSDISKGSIIVYDVSDNGIVVGVAGKLRQSAPEGSTDPNDRQTMPFSYNVDTKEFTWLSLDVLPQLGDEMDGRQPTASSMAWSISADGRSISGYVGFPSGSGNGLSYIPVVWRDNAVIVLAHPKTGTGDGNPARGYYPRKISADGNTVFGNLVDRQSYEVGCYWLMSDPSQIHFYKNDDGQFYQSVTGNDGVATPRRYPTTENISADGKVVTSSIVDITSGSSVYTPFSYNIETGETNVATIAPGSRGAFTMPDGAIMCTVLGASRPSGSVVYLDGKVYSLNDWLANEHNSDINTTPLFAFTLRDASATGKIMVGYYVYAEQYVPVFISL